MIHITDGKTDKILDFIPLGDFWDDSHYKSLKDNIETYDFSTFANKRFSKYLADRNRVVIPDEDGKYIEFIISNHLKYRDQNGALFYKVYTSGSYIDLAKAKIISPQTLEGQTALSAAKFALNGTEFEVGQVDFAGIKSIKIEQHTNPFSLLKKIASEFDLELHFRVATDGNKITRRYVDLLKRVGTWQGREAEFGKDLVGIERKVDDSNIVTALVGLGPVKEEGTRLEVFVEDADALERWGRRNPQTGLLMHLIETYEPESIDEDMTLERLTQLTENELKKRINSLVEYSGEVIDLEKIPGLENEKFRLGDTIKIKDTGYNPPLYLEARVHTQDRSLSQPEKKKVILGDYIEYQEEEVNSIWKTLQIEIAKKVSMSQVTEVVYTKNEVNEQIDRKADTAYVENIRDTLVDDYQGAIQNKTEEILDNVNNSLSSTENSLKDYTDNIINQTAEQLESNLSNIQQSVDEQSQAINEIRTNVQITEDGLNLSKNGNPFAILIDNEKMSFKENGATVQYISGQKTFIPILEVPNSLIVGSHKFTKYNNEITVIQWAGE